MTPRVRFAPSPTGYLHIGGARTALYNYLYAKSVNGQYILRIEDTDFNRSEDKFEKLQIQDMEWLGINYDVGPGKEDEHGPYRQSERLHIYQEYAQKLIDMGLAYYDFCTDAELEAMKEKSKEEGSDPHYSGKWKEAEFFEEGLNRVKNGEKAPIRFRAYKEVFTFTDKVRGTVTFPDNMVGDFVILRSNGLPTYNFSNVIDDHLHLITHVLRGEEHLNNTVRQLMIYKAFNWDAPEFAHLSLLIGKDRQKLSKRHGATSVHLYKEQHYLPSALNNYITLLGWSHPEEKDIFTPNELISVFNLNRFSKAPAIYEIEKLNFINSKHLKMLSEDELYNYLSNAVPKEHFFHNQSKEWQKKCIQLFKEKIQIPKDFILLLDENFRASEINISPEVQEVLDWESTKNIANYLSEKIAKIETDFINESFIDETLNDLKTNFGIKGKNLFMGTRVVLTGVNHGSDLKILTTLIPVKKLKENINFISSKL